MKKGITAKNKKTAVKNTKILTRGAEKEEQIRKQNIALKQFAKIGKNLEYRKCGDGNLHLLNNSIDTGIMIKRSHEGYSRFACWYVIDNGKIKKDYPVKEKESEVSARAKGISIYLEKLSNDILKVKGGGK